MLFLITCFAQKEEAIYHKKGGSIVKDGIRLYENGTCKPDKFDLGGNSRLRFMNKLRNDESVYVIEVLNAPFNVKVGDNFPDPNLQYCIDKSVFEEQYRSTKYRISYGALAVPFKIRFDPGTISPGGELGGYFGVYLGQSSWILGVHGGATVVSLNNDNSNSDTPDNMIGATLGIALINDFDENFQLGVVSGVDFFEGANDWAYGYTPWLSFQIGFKFAN
jgi:hypothetical protein